LAGKQSEEARGWPIWIADLSRKCRNWDDGVVASVSAKLDKPLDVL